MRRPKTLEEYEIVYSEMLKDMAKMRSEVKQRDGVINCLSESVKTLNERLDNRIFKRETLLHEIDLLKLENRLLKIGSLTPGLEDKVVAALNAVEGMK